MGSSKYIWAVPFCLALFMASWLLSRTVGIALKLFSVVFLAVVMVGLIVELKH